MRSDLDRSTILAFAPRYMPLAVVQIARLGFEQAMFVAVEPALIS